MAKKSTDHEAPAPTPGDDFKTQREKLGTGPVSEPVEPGTKAQVLKIDVGQPYPEGSPPDPEDQFFAAHGYRREKP